ncbi:hypothetical protein G6O69_34180 [Pseudenhygromyxa sp. WMMC2535]|uniref:hypothetical protein n=1 Tax=Pseudenhygromyxa sp. WMMC2535 TaxID=2712867 RepID=UPI0015521ACA|nr:hypothetical protein [Pseudenhygromyxa sp. WMMC2535]NVB42920.1 hypothetical protein [Pseudenhygromyxa sp. WMMC2535]
MERLALDRLARPRFVIPCLALALALSACDDPEVEAQTLPQTQLLAAVMTPSEGPDTDEVAREIIHDGELAQRFGQGARASDGDSDSDDDSVEPEGLRPSWTLVGTTEAETHFADLDRGVLMFVGEQRFTIGEAGELVAAPRKAKSKHEVVGSWPDNAWTVRMRYEERAGIYMRMAKWKGNNRWVPQPIRDLPEDFVWAYEGKWHEFATAFWGSVGGRGGYLLALEDYDNERLLFRRVAGKNFAPVPLDWDDTRGSVQDIRELPSGRLLVFSEVRGESTFENKVVERAPCRRNCEVETLDLPSVVSDRSYGRMVVRGEDELSVELRNNELEISQQLLSRDADGWVVDASPVDEGDFRELAATANVGLLAVVGVGEREQLWQRDAAGAWTAIALPEGFDALTEGASLDLDVTRVDDETLWVAFNGPDSHAVYALPADLG